MSNDKMRDAFEQWVMSFRLPEDQNDKSILNTCELGYREDHVQHKWEGWQACAEAIQRLDHEPENEPAVSLASVQPTIPQSAILERRKYHKWVDDDGTEDWELFEPDVACDDCIDVLIIRANAVVVGQEPQPKRLTDEEIFDLAGNYDCGTRYENEKWNFTSPNQMLTFSRAIEAKILGDVK